jgi:hypothetical protein
MILCVQAHVQALESDLRKSRRAEQKLQALLYRLRQDVAAAGKHPEGAFEQLQEVRSLEYDVDFWTNTCKVCGSSIWGWGLMQVVQNASYVRLSLLVDWVWCFSLLGAQL